MQPLRAAPHLNAMNGLIALAGVLALLLLAGLPIGLLDRRRFSLRWLLVAALLVAINDASLTLPPAWTGHR